MTFPTSPTNGQSVTLNGVEYTYNSTKTAWLKTTAGSGTVPTTVSGTLTVTGNANVGNLGTSGTIISSSANVGSFVFADANGVAVRTGAGNYGLRLYPGGGSDANTSILQFTNSAQNAQYGTMAFSGTVLSLGSDVATPVAVRVNSANVLVVNTGSTTVTANILPSANVTYNLGSTTARWATVFTGDLDLSNGIGDWTIVEGEEDLFIYNNKKNKVYKFNLIEVDPAAAPPKKEI